MNFRRPGRLLLPAGAIPLAAVLLLFSLRPGAFSAPAAAPPPPPQWIGLYDMEGKVGLKWIHDARFTAVRVYRSTREGGGSFELLAETGEGRYIDESVVSGTYLTYRLTAVGAGGVEGPPSQERTIRITFVSRKPVSSPRWEGYLFTESGVGLKWQRQAGEDVLAWNVYRKAPVDEDFRLVGSTTEANYHDRDIEVGTHYVYVLTALDSRFLESFRSEELAVSVPLPEALPAKSREDDWQVMRTRLVRTVTGGDTPFFRPADVALNAMQGRVFVSDSGAAKIQVFTLDGDYVRSFSGGRGDDSFLRNPLGVETDGAGNLYAVDASESTVFVLAPSGAVQRRIDLRRLFPATTMGLIDAAVTPDGRIFVVDNYNNRVAVVGAEGLVRSFGEQGFLGGQMSAPTFCDSDSAGFLYLSDALNARVQIFDSSGEFVRSFGRYRQGPGGLGRPKGIAVGGKGEVYVADSWQNVIQVFDGEGRFLAVLTDENGKLLDLGSPNGIALDRNRIYIVERLTNRLQIREILDAL